MQVAEIIALIKDAIEDESFSDGTLLAYVNKGIGRVAAALPLPMLLTEAHITCKANSRRVTLPSDYYSNLFHAYNVTSSAKVRIMRPFSNFLMRFPSLDLSSDVTHVCTQANVLHYQGSPSSDQTLLVFYNRRPDAVSAGDDIDIIEEVYQADLLVSFAAAECYKLIENGIEGTKVNYNKWIADYTLALNEYGLFVGSPEEKPDFIPDDEGGEHCPSI